VAQSVTTDIVTYWPSPSRKDVHVGALIDDIPDLRPIQDMPMKEDEYYWTYGDDEEDEATVCAMLEAEDPQEAIKQRQHYRAYAEGVMDD